MDATQVLDRAPTRPAGHGGHDARCAAPRGGHDGPGSPGLTGDARRFGLWMFLGTVTMLFIGFTSAYMVRRTAFDWRELPVPAALWLSTALILASSGGVEKARRCLRSWRPAAVRPWLVGAGALGAAFVSSQLLAWRQLAGAGLRLANSPHAAFFYILTGLHAVHLLGGLVWYAATLRRALRLELVPGRDGLGLFATYWHFLAALWIYLFLLLFVL